MLWLHHEGERIHPVLHSLRRTISNRRHTERQQELYQSQTNWKIVGSMTSLVVFLVLLTFTIIGLPILLTKAKTSDSCSTSVDWIYWTNSTPPWANQSNVSTDSRRLCAENASWNPRGVTVAGLGNGSSSTTLNGLQYPSDIFVYDDGTLLVTDTINNRIIKWDRNATEGVLIAGTGVYGSWADLLAKPIALTVQNDQLYASDQDNYRIQVFPLNTNLTSPNGTTLLGRNGRGSNLDQINQVTNLQFSRRFPFLLYLCDSANDRILVYDTARDSIRVIAGVSGVSGKSPALLSNPSGIAVDEQTMSIYIADRSNDRIQKYDYGSQRTITTVVDWSELSNPYDVQLDSSGENLFIADSGHHRVLLWSNRTQQSRIIAGTGLAGADVSQLNTPTQIRFDGDWNLYVADTMNSRIQRFDLLSDGC